MKTLLVEFDEDTYFWCSLMKTLTSGGVWWRHLLLVQFDEDTYFWWSLMKTLTSGAVWWRHLLLVQFDEDVFTQILHPDRGVSMLIGQEGDSDGTVRAPRNLHAQGRLGRQQQPSLLTHTPQSCYHNHWADGGWYSDSLRYKRHRNTSIKDWFKTSTD